MIILLAILFGLLCVFLGLPYILRDLALKMLKDKNRWDRNND